MPQKFLFLKGFSIANHLLLSHNSKEEKEETWHQTTNPQQKENLSSV